MEWIRLPSSLSEAEYAKAHEARIQDYRRQAQGLFEDEWGTGSVLTVADLSDGGRQMSLREACLRFDCTPEAIRMAAAKRRPLHGHYFHIVQPGKPCPTLRQLLDSIEAKGRKGRGHSKAPRKVQVINLPGMVWESINRAARALGESAAEVARAAAKRDYIGRYRLGFVTEAEGN